MSQPDRNCRKCNAPLLFAPNIETAKMVPLDTRSAVYLVYVDDKGVRRAWDLNDLLATDAGAIALKMADGALKPLKVLGVHVTHFATCPKATEFSKQDGKPPGLFGKDQPRTGMSDVGRR